MYYYHVVSWDMLESQLATCLNLCSMFSAHWMLIEVEFTIKNTKISAEIGVLPDLMVHRNVPY